MQEIVLAKVNDVLKSYKKRPIFVGISGPQGSGKTTISRNLVLDLNAAGIKASTFSIDDLYFPAQIIEKNNTGNPLLEFRGNPGTHDLELGRNVLEKLESQKAGFVEIPVYDKSLNNGRGDRAPSDQWQSLKMPIDVVVLEGWCLGFKNISKSAAIAQIESSKLDSALRLFSRDHIIEVQNHLSEYEKLFDFMDFIIQISAENIENVYKWRQEQEETLRKNKRDNSAGLSEEQVSVFVSRFMPQYVLCLPSLDAGFFKESGKQLRIVIDENRNVIKQEII